MKVFDNGKPVILDASDRLGAGGQGQVFRLGTKEVAKTYFKPDSTTASKIKHMLAHPPSIPTGIAPLGELTDQAGQFIGYKMKRIPIGYEDLAKLAIKKERNQHKDYTAKDVAELFLNGWKSLTTLHREGYIVGDFSDTNEQFSGHTMLFLDMDAYQVGKFPCPVGTEQFLAPRLYGKALDKQTSPLFLKEDDWYSFAVLLFKSLVYVHPYGGTHKTIRLLTQRAQQRIAVWDASVTYPKATALALNLISDELAQVFYNIFSAGHRGEFPADALEKYADYLTVCRNCGAAYPYERPVCPLCGDQTIIPFTSNNKGVSIEVMLEGQGTILFSKQVGGKLYVITEDQGHVTLYRWQRGQPLKRNFLGEYQPGTRFDIHADELVTNFPHSNVIYAGTRELETDVFAATQKAMYRSNGRYLFRIVGGQLMYRETNAYDQVVERALRPVSHAQTWFTVRQDMLDKPTVCGFFQVFTEQKWWLVFEGRLYDQLRLTPLEQDEFQKEVLVRMDSHSALVKRVTERKGVLYLHTALISEAGEVQNTPPTRLLSPLEHGAVYAHRVLLYGTSDGLVQESATGSQKTFSQTLGVIEDGDTLYTEGTGLLVVKQDKVLLVQLS